ATRSMPGALVATIVPWVGAEPSPQSTVAVKSPSGSACAPWIALNEATAPVKAWPSVAATPGSAAAPTGGAATPPLPPPTALAATILDRDCQGVVPLFLIDVGPRHLEAAAAGPSEGYAARRRDGAVAPVDHRLVVADQAARVGVGEDGNDGRHRFPFSTRER